MGIYLMINSIVIMVGIVFFANIKESNNDILKNIYLVFIGLVLIIISGLRGDFTSDYAGYEYIFHFHNQFNDFGMLLKYKYDLEIGYTLMNWIIGRFTDNSAWIFITSSIIIVSLYLNEIKKYSSNIFLSVLLFVTIGGYYTSFNTMRQIISAAIIFSGSTFLYEKKIIKYALVVLVASLFHKTALLMFPFYFILNFKFNYKKLYAALIALLLVSKYINYLLELIQRFFYSNYQAGNHVLNGYEYKNIILPIGVLFFVITAYAIKPNIEDGKLNVWFNATMLYAFFSLLALNIQIVERISSFFLSYVLLIIPEIITNENNKYLRIIYYFMIISASILYNFFSLNGSGYDPYYFIWNK